jgi:hypothetical protein
MVHELHVPNEIRQEFLFVAMTYAVGSLAFKYVMRIKIDGLVYSGDFWWCWVCAHCKSRFLILCFFFSHIVILY